MEVLVMVLVKMIIMLRIHEEALPVVKGWRLMIRSNAENLLLLSYSLFPMMVVMVRYAHHGYPEAPSPQKTVR